MHWKSQTNQEQNPRYRLMEAAVSLFSENGYTGTAVREIVDRAGVTKPVLYYYFKSKEGLFRAILDEASEWQLSIISEVLDTPGTALERLIRLYRLVYEAIQENPEFLKFIHALILGLHRGSPDYDLEKFHLRMIDTVKTIYLEGLRRKELLGADPDDVASLIMGVTDFCIHMDTVFPKKSDRERPERLLRLAFRGLGNTRDEARDDKRQA